MNYAALKDSLNSVHVLSLGFGALAVLAQGGSLAINYWLVKTSLGVGYLGVWALIQAVLVFGRVAEFGMSQSLIHFMPKAMAERNTTLARRYFDTVFLSSAILFISIAALLYFPANRLIARSIEGDFLPVLEAVFPMTVLAFIVLNIGQTGINALIGLQKAYQSHAIVIVAFITNVIVVFKTIDSHGLLALAYGNLAAGFIMLIVGNLVTSLNIGTMLLLPIYFKVENLKSIVGIGVGIQAISLMSAAADASAKFFINYFVGIQAVGIFEMAVRFVLFARGLFALPQNYLGSHFGAMAKSDPEALQGAIERSMRVSLNLAFIFVATVLISRYWVGQVWVGKEAPLFEALTVLLIIGWFFNVLVSPVYYGLLGLGKMPQLIIAQIVYATLTFLSCVIIGATFGLYGQVLAFTLSLAVSQIFLLQSGSKVMKAGLAPLITWRVPVMLAVLLMVFTMLPYVDQLALADASPMSRFFGFGVFGLLYLAVHISIDGTLLRYLRNRSG